MSAVDVVITTYNRPDQLARCLSALASQTVRDFEVTVVDDCSEGPVESVVRAAASRGLPASYLRTPRNQGPAAGRNLGVSHGGASLVLFVDDDVVAAPDLVEQHLLHSRSHTAVIGPLLPPRDWRLSPWVRWEAATLQAEYERMARGVYQPTWRQFFTGNASVPRADLERSGGFDSRFVRAEDIELGLRLSREGCSFVFAPSAVGWHYAARSLAAWKQIPGRYAQSDYGIDCLHPSANWLETLALERASRRPAGRLVLRSCRALKLDRAAAVAAVGVAVALDRAGLTKAAMGGLSFAYEALYARALEETQESARVRATR